MIRIGIICPSEIALRRFLPALSKLREFEFIGVSIANANEWEGSNSDIISREREKANLIIEQYGGVLFDSYISLIESDNVDAIYLPLPPALHYKWAKLCLLAGKHVLVEKPATTAFMDTKDLVSIASQRSLGLHENYMFVFHDQLKAIDDIISSGEIGDVRLYRISFGFPRRTSDDFRYIKRLGGGALLDCGGYTIKYATKLLGKTARISCATSNYIDGFDVDLYGSAVLVNEIGTTVQISFGMDNDYKCELEVWGSKGTLAAGRVLTAPADYVPQVRISIGNSLETRPLPADDAFLKSIQKFEDCILEQTIREINYEEIILQAEQIEQFYHKAKME